MPFDLDQINASSEVLANSESWYAPNSNGQQTLKSAAKQERVKEIHSALTKAKMNTDIILWGDRSNQKIESAIYLSEPSGKVKTCERCEYYVLDWNPLQDQLVCTDCGHVMQSRATRGSTSKSTSKKKSAFINVIDKSFIDPETRDQKMSEALEGTKYDYIQDKLIELAEKLETEIGSKEFRELINNSGSRQKRKKEFLIKSEKYRVQLEALKVKQNALVQIINLELNQTFTIQQAMEATDTKEKYPEIYGLLQKYFDEENKIREELTKLR